MSTFDLSEVYQDLLIHAFKHTVMQRKSTPPSHPFHVVLRLIVFGLCLMSGGPMAYGSVFHIECPPDVTVNCDAELWDLSVYGNAVVYG